MCGISGILHQSHGTHTTRAELETLRDAMTHRGPDDAGLWLSEDRRVGLGHRRLSIIDLSPSGHQPMACETGRYQLVYNGEIYNFKSLRAELEALGHRFRSSCDAEVILHGYRAWGLELLDRLRGMFAFALHDTERRETFLARDPLGIKPLYLLDDGGRWLFASEIQALRAVADGGDVDPEALASYLQWGSIAPPRTLYSRIRSLPAGSWLRIGSDSSSGPIRYFSLADCFGRQQDMDEQEALAAAREALSESARCHLVADVPVGVFLSGGVDSTALLGLLRQHSDTPLRSVTLGFDDEKLGEAAYARQASEQYGSEHYETTIGENEACERMPDAIAALDQPSVDGVNTYLVSEWAARSGLKVVVSGVGGDELFGGYSSFDRVPRIRAVHRRLQPLAPLFPFAAAALDALPPSSRRSRLSLALRFGGTAAGAYVAERGINTPAEVRALLTPELADAVEASDPARELAGRLNADGLSQAEQVSAFELCRYLQTQLLRDTDATSMRHSLEIRTPLVDRELLLKLTRIPTRFRMARPAKHCLRVAPRPAVPDALWNRPKQGFVMPFDSWLRTGKVSNALPSHPWLRDSALRRVRQRFESGHLHFSKLWLLTVLRQFL